MSAVSSDLGCSGVILAGGLNTRFGGKEKAFLRVGGVAIIDRLVGVFEKLFEDITVVTNNPQNYLYLKHMIVSDVLNLRSSLTGIHAGLFYASTPFCFICACDTPFLSTDVVRFIVAQANSRIDAAIPKTSGGWEPLCALYSKRCLQAVEHQLGGGKRTINRLFPHLRKRVIAEQELRTIDPELKSFFNINTPDDLDKAEALCASPAV